MANIPVQSFTLSDESASSRANYTPALISLGVLYFMMGAITCLNDTLVPFFKAGFTLTYSESSLVQFYFFLTYGIMSIPAGKIVERIGYKNGMVAGFSIAAAGALLFYPASVFHQYFLFLGALFIIAVGIVLLQVAANPYITVLGPAETASSRLTLIQGVGSLGTTVAPIFGAYFILSSLESTHASSSAVRVPYMGIGLLLLMIAVAVSRMKLPVIKTSSSQPGPAAKKHGSIFQYRNLKFGAPAIFAYVGAEVTIGTFLTNYISDTVHLPVEHANKFVAFFWGSMMVGRFIGSAVLKTVRPSLVLRVCGILAVSLIIISISSSGYFAVISMIGVGLCNSVMFAIIFSLSVDRLGEYTPRASGILSSAIVGGAVISYLTGIMKDHFTWPVAFIIPVLCYAYIVFYALDGYKQKES